MDDEGEAYPHPGAIVEELGLQGVGSPFSG
jgi:hypothetical protein